MKQLITFLTIFALSSLSLLAQTEQDIKKSISARSAEVKTLWAQKVAGIDNTGYLEIKAANVTSRQAEIIQSENADRKTLYMLIAKRTGKKLSEIEKISAMALHKTVPAGTMIQKPDGDWIVKN